MKRACWASVRLAWIALIVVLVLGWAQALHPAFDSFSHFRLHFVVALMIVGFIYRVGRRALSSLTCAIIVVVSLFLSAPFLPGFGPPSVGLKTGSQNTAPLNAGKKIIRIAQMNLQFNNPYPQRAIEQLRKSNADIIILQEVTGVTKVIPEALRATHPNQITCRSARVGSVGILSRFPFNSDDNQDCDRFLGFATAGVLVGDQSITVASVHLRWPWPFSQYRHMNNLSNQLAKLPSPLVIAGDFNAAPWSNVVSRLASASNTEVVSGLQLTWAPRMVELELTIGGILPIDHILVSPELNVVSRTKLGDGGSDHFPLVTELRLPQGES